MTALPVITVRQPWAWAMFRAGKGTENRTRNIVGRYRGPLLIHTSRRVDDTDGIDRCVDLANPEATKWADDEHAGVLGFIIGAVDLFDVHFSPNMAAAFCRQCVNVHGEVTAWDEPGMWHLSLRNQQLLTTPVAAVGKLGMWWWTAPAGWTLEGAL